MINNLNKEKSKKRIEVLVWIYFFLLIFEGALRKWFLPFMSNELILVRDPFAIIIIFFAHKDNLLSRVSKMYFIFPLIGVLSFIMTLLVGHGSLPVAIFGLRPFILHLPLVFIIGLILDRRFVVKLGIVVMYLLIPMTIILIIQFYSPQSAWINRGVGNDIEGSGFGGALGFFRSSGTFSFINGLSLFYGLASAYTFYFIIEPQYLKKSILFLCIISILLSIPFTISRTVFFQNILSLIFLFVVLLRKPRFFKKLLTIFFFSCLVVLLFSDIKYVTTAVEAFMSRFENANETEGGVKDSLLNRTFGTSLDMILSNDLTFFGEGIGKYSNVGIQKFNIKNYKVADFEWIKILTEMGMIFGFVFLFFRIKILFSFFLQTRKRIKENDCLPWMLFSFGSVIIMQGQLSQPTSLGFFTLISGLMIASLKKTKIVQ